MDGDVKVPSPEEIRAQMAAIAREFEANPEHPALIGKPEGNPVQIRPAFPSGSQWAARLREGVSANVNRYSEGVRRPRANFKEAALRNNAGWKASVQKAVTEDRFAKGIQKVNEDEAIELAATLGASAYVQGVEARAAKIERAGNELAPKMAAAVETVRRMPATTDQEREARAVAMIRAAREVGRT